MVDTLHPVIVILMAIIFFIGFFLGVSLTNEFLKFKDPLEQIKVITIIDNDPLDNSVFTLDKHIYNANKYEFKLLEINHSYICNIHLNGIISNCTPYKVIK